MEVLIRKETVTRTPVVHPTATEVRRRPTMTSVADLHLTPAALAVLEKRYLHRDPEGRIIETPIDLFRRVAHAIAIVDKEFGASEEEIAQTEEDFYDMMTHMEFLSGMTLPNAGAKIQQLSACYVLPLGDSMDEIYTTLRYAAFLHKTGAGIGYDFSPLRSRGERVSTTSKESSGPVSFMRLINFSSETIVNNAATRRAGNMGVLRVDHPDIEEFIHVKRDNSELNNFNISVGATNAFIEAVKKGDSFGLVDPHTKLVKCTVDARELFDTIAQNAWASAEPGMLFMDHIESDNPTPHVGHLRATNQCGEQPLLPYENCNLGSVVLSNFVVRKGPGAPYMDWDRLRDVIHKAVHFLDNTIDGNHYPLPEIRKVVKEGNRKIGLGVMGLADAFVYLGIRYNSQEAVDFSDKVMSFIEKESHAASSELAKARGNFPNFKGSKWEKRGYAHLRNATVTTIAPTGTTAMIANCSSGIEPIFALAFVRKNILDFGEDEYLEVNPVLEEIAKDHWFYSKELMKQVAETGGLHSIQGVPSEFQELFVTAHDIEYRWHILIQAAFQQSVDNAVSKTINMPNSATKQDVADAYMMAFDTNCKGVTIYRDGSRSQQVLNRTHS
ncbi:MAG: adenosylcobalamin-dependent ribonucleoside-diphosphate reductase [Candidatus Kerfeldbacteria bacterium]|nr:adenosylcobalamin-dependent ribonucleoside-diphosphate reductase [Candidatus Kerfeldbacteria bacterium]